jgi:hypothetical protein
LTRLPEERGEGDRSFIWGRPASPSMFPV